MAENGTTFHASFYKSAKIVYSIFLTFTKYVQQLLCLLKLITIIDKLELYRDFFLPRVTQRSLPVWFLTNYLYITLPAVIVGVEVVQSKLILNDFFDMYFIFHLATRACKIKKKLSKYPIFLRRSVNAEISDQNFNF